MHSMIGSTSREDDRKCDGGSDSKSGTRWTFDTPGLSIILNRDVRPIVKRVLNFLKWLNVQNSSTFESLSIWDISRLLTPRIWLPTHELSLIPTIFDPERNWAHLVSVRPDHAISPSPAKWLDSLFQHEQPSTESPSFRSRQASPRFDRSCRFECQRQRIIHVFPWKAFW
jgi:hypothetical protein